MSGDKDSGLVFPFCPGYTGHPYHYRVALWKKTKQQNLNLLECCLQQTTLRITYELLRAYDAQKKIPYQCTIVITNSLLQIHVKNTLFVHVLLLKTQHVYLSLQYTRYRPVPVKEMKVMSTWADNEYHFTYRGPNATKNTCVVQTRACYFGCLLSWKVITSTT